MDLIADDAHLPRSPPSPPPQPKLKRLKKSLPPAPPPPPPPNPNKSADLSSPAAGSENLASKDAIFVSDEREKVRVVKKRLSMEDDADGSELDPLFSVPETEDREWESNGEGEEGRSKGKGKVKKSVKRRVDLDDKDSPAKKKKKKRRDVKVKDPVRETKRIEKERKEQLVRIHAESQRLLRETRNASFKPANVVQKPISSVLEKIRLRKLEVLRQCSLLQESDSYPDIESPAADDSQSRDVTEPPSVAKEDDNSRMSELGSQSDAREDDAEVAGLELQSDANKNDSAKKMGLKSRIDAKEDDITRMEGVESGSDTKEDDDGRPDEHTGSELSDTDKNPSGNNRHRNTDDVGKQSPSVSNSKHDLDDMLSDDEDSDKENISPHPRPRRTVDTKMYPKGGPANVFLDVEAEEEDDSDHDMMRFQENEDDESDDNEELNDLIATGYEEAPVDNEKRNELHQKWLEQQDTAATDNFLQKLKSRHKHREPTVTLEEDDEDSEEGSEEDGSYDTLSVNEVQKSTRKAKQMMAQMFNDGNDTYVPSDDEETEQTLIRQRFLKHTVETSLTSPLDDDNSKEVFGLIKKMNVVPVSTKRVKTTTSFDMLMMSGNSNSSSKSSFLGRTTSSSLPASHKPGPVVRAYIFGRDDSNSRSNFSTAEKVSDTGHEENQPAKVASTKLIGSQFKQPASKTKNDNPGPGSLFEILRQSSAQFDKQTGSKLESKSQMSESQMAQQFSVFKLGKKFSKV